MIALAAPLEANRSPKNDQRYFPRWESNKKVSYQTNHGPDEKEALALDMSFAGACILSEEPLLPTLKIKLNIFLDQATVVRLSGHIVWVRHALAHNQAGIVFDEVDQKTQDMILDHAFDINRDDLVKHWYKGWGGPT